MDEDNEEAPPHKPMLERSFIQDVDKKDPLALRMLKAIDIFSFIPVPKDEAVSTKQSLIGTTIFFLLFFAFVLFDLISFVTDNPPIQ